ncbi:hypothetical protein CSIRO_0249 [Bradyrhizobiaceae bacterium SG-6C]|nr:hypothetical protein CSIRO_0249 [Bradyrhizobiaceae bacterium SG-6C]
MLPAIGFDNQSAFAAYEITNVAADWFLPHKFTVGDLPVT